MIIISPSAVIGGSSASEVDTSDYPRIYWQSFVTTSTLAADYASTAEPVLNMLNQATSLKWRSTSVATQYLRVTFPTAEDIDYVAIAAHNLGSVGCSIQLQYSFDGASWTDVFDLVTPRSDDSTFIAEFDTLFAKYYRLKLVGATDFPAIGVLQLGTKTVLQRKIYVGHTPIAYGRDTTVSSGRSESGQFLGRVLRREFLECSVEQKNITPLFYRQTIEPFVSHARTGAFFFSWRPVSYPLETAYCWLTKEVRPSNQLVNGMMQFSLMMQGIR